MTQYQSIILSVVIRYCMKPTTPQQLRQHAVSQRNM